MIWWLRSYSLHTFSSPLISTSCEHRLLLKAQWKAKILTILVVSTDSQLKHQARRQRSFKFKRSFYCKVCTSHFPRGDLQWLNWNISTSSCSSLFSLLVNLYSTVNTDSKYRRLKSIKKPSQIPDTELLQRFSILNFYCLNSKPVIQSQKQKVLLNP